MTVGSLTPAFLAISDVVKKGSFSRWDRKYGAKIRCFSVSAVSRPFIFVKRSCGMEAPSK